MGKTVCRLWGPIWCLLWALLVLAAVGYTGVLWYSRGVMIIYPVSGPSDNLDRESAEIGGKPLRISSDVIKRLQETSEENKYPTTVTYKRRHERNHEKANNNREWGSKGGQDVLSDDLNGGRSHELPLYEESKAGDGILPGGVARNKDGSAGTISEQISLGNTENLLISFLKGFQNKTWINEKEKADPWKYSDVDEILRDLAGKIETLQELDKTLGSLVGDQVIGWYLQQRVRQAIMERACTSPGSPKYTSDATKMINEMRRTLRRMPETEAEFHRYHLLEGRRRAQRKRASKQPQKDGMNGSHDSLADLVSRNDLNHLLVDDLHKLIFCYVPKTACTQWRKVLMVLLRTTDRAMEDIEHHRAHDKTKIPNLADRDIYTPTQVYQRLGEYSKVLVSRRPLERLLSAYRDKFEAGTKEALAFENTYARDWIRRLRGSNAKDSSKLTFEEMLKAITSHFERPTFFDEHWQPVYHLCHPCTLPYDYIIDFNHLQGDSDRVLEAVQGLKGAEKGDSVTFPKVYKSETPSLLEDYQEKLDVDLLHRVRDLYSVDWEMFQ